MAKSFLNRRRQQNIVLSEGILLTDDLTGHSAEEKNDRLSSLLVRAFFLFAIVTGSLGGMMSAFQISYAKWGFFLAALLAALYCASLYLSGWWENVGYTLIFIFALYAGLGMRVYISSGFYGILNDISISASSFFGAEAEVSYAEQVENHYLAVSVSMCYFAFIGCIIMNGLISRKAKYYAAAIPSLFFLLVPIYLECEPAGGYVILLTAGLLTVYILRQNRYRCHRPQSKFLQKAAAKHLFYGNSSAGAVMAALLIIALLCSGVVSIASLLFPESSYTAGHEKSALKLQTMDTMENFYLLGVMGLINYYPTTGGLVNGRLGGVNSIRLDYEPDLTLEFVPYTYDRIYLKTFVGAAYVPYENHWSTEDPNAYAEGWDTDTALRLNNAFAADPDNYAQGRMKIKNVAAMNGVYLPYYSEDTHKTILPTATQTYTYYPLLENQPSGSAKPITSDFWLSVPEANETALADFCNEAGLTGSPAEIIDGLRDYFQSEYPYTLSPGITPRGKDFVNYFLLEKRKGYCAHYASSAVLILRYLGIPARYVEGYAIDAVDVAADAELTDLNVADYYEGASLIPQNSVVSYAASDANAHAWVEVYDETRGWYPVELTPYRINHEESRTSIWDMFARLFQNGQNADVTASNTADQADETDMADTLRTSAHRLAFCLLMLLITIPVWLLVRKGLQIYRYDRANRSEKLLIKYHSFIHRKIKREPESLKSFEEQVAWLAAHEYLNDKTASPERLIQILNKAAYSEEEISEAEFEVCSQTIASSKSPFK